MRRPDSQAATRACTALSMATLLASLRYFSRAATVLSMTLTSTSPVRSSASTLRWMNGTPSLTLPASFSLKSERPSYPTLRQNRTTVGLLTCARSASSLTGSLAKDLGSPSTRRPTRCSAGASEGSEALMRSSMAAALRSAKRDKSWTRPDSTFFAPAMAVASDQGAGGARPPGAGSVGPGAGGVLAPMLDDRLDPAPGFLLLVAAHKQVEPAIDDVQQQPFVGAHPLRAEALVEVEVQMHRGQQRRRAPGAHPVLLSLRQQMQLQAVPGLQVDHEAVGGVHRRMKYRMRRRPEIHHDSRIAACQALAGADVERHAGPAPVGDLGAHGHECLRRAARADTRFFAVARHRLAGDRAAGVLPANHVLAQCFPRPGLERAQDLELLVANGVGVRVDGRLHRDRAKQLQGMVLHHVAQRAGIVIEGAAHFDTQVFRDGDLDVADGFAPPQRLEQGVAEAQREQVLDRGLAQVVVDPEDLFLTEHPAHGLVDGTVRRQVMAQRFFQHDAGARGDQSGGSQLLARGGEQRRRRRQVHHDLLSLPLVQRRGQPLVILGTRQIHPHELQQTRKTVEFSGAGPFFQLDF